MDSIWASPQRGETRPLCLTGGRIFDEAVYNYARGSPYIWDEISAPVGDG